MTVFTYPLALGDVTPSPEFTKLPLPPGEGMHTGGPWLSPAGEVWKPLDALPFVNAEVRVATHEAEVLAHMRGRPGWPSHWRVEERNGRRWLVRPRVLVIPDDYEAQWLREATVLEVEQILRGLNQERWELCTELRVALDPHDYAPFILDLSTAYRRTVAECRTCYAPDDQSMWERWAEQMGFPHVVKLRRDARQALYEFTLGETLSPGAVHVYGSDHRPMSGAWARIPNAYYAPASKSATGMYTWVITPEPLDDETRQRYELVWGWSPLRYVEA